MDIHKITRDRLMNISSAEQTLKTGQILKGKILKIYPNNKAQIQLGTRTMVAQLELALAVGEQYHFRVEASEEIVHLKVIGEHLQGRPEQNVADLIKSLGLKVNQNNINFTQDLIKLKIPFEKRDLIRSFSLLENVKDKNQAQQVLKEMMIQKRPITESVFQALMSKSTTTLSEEMKATIHQLRSLENPTKLQQQLLEKLIQINEAPLTNRNHLLSQMLQESITNNEQTFNVLKTAGLINETTDFLNWKSELSVFATQNNIHLSMMLNDQLQATNMALSHPVETASEVMEQLKILQTNLDKSSEITAHHWKSIINKATTSLSDQDLARLKQEITENILPLLTRAQQLTTIDPLLLADREVTGQMLEELRLATLELQTQSQKVINQWAKLMKEVIGNRESFIGQNGQQLKQDMINQIFPLVLTRNSFATNEQLTQLQTKLPFQMETMEQSLQHMKNIESTLRSESQVIVARWANLINKSVIQNQPFSNESFAQMKQQITEKIYPLLTTGQQELVDKQLQNNPEQLRQLLTTLQTYSNEQTYMKVEQMLTNLHKSDLSGMILPQEQLLSQIKEMLLLSGMSHENTLMQDVSEQEGQTIKSILIQMVQQGEGVNSERVQQLLHLMNGLQLQSVSETGSFIQASIQIPGEKLSLNNDLFIEFESKKTEDGKINPDFCRILFYLDLKTLKETIIDMQVQKRLVSATIFNDHERMNRQSSLLQPMLKKGLESINYQLSNIMVKPLQASNHTKKSSAKQTFHNTYEGIEFRV